MAKSTTRKAQEGAGIEIPQIETATVEIHLVGSSPLIMNPMNQKVSRVLLAPPPPKNRADKASRLKHDPMAEYRESMYLMREQSSAEPTLLGMPSTAFKTAMITAAKDVPGSSKAQMGRLTFVESDMVPIYGVPQLFCAVTRQSDINHTPDVRTRAILPTWAARVLVTYVKPLLKYQDIFNLMTFAGVTIGVGDWRQEKGSGNYGRWRLVNANDPEYVSIVASGGLEAQKVGYDTPTMYNHETESLLSWFFDYAEDRGFNPTR